MHFHNCQCQLVTYCTLISTMIITYTIQSTYLHHYSYGTVHVPVEGNCPLFFLKRRVQHLQPLSTNTRTACCFSSPSNCTIDKIQALMTECDVVLHKALHNTITNNPSFQLISHQNIALQLMFSFHFLPHYSIQPVTACNTHMATRIFFSSEIYLHKTLPCVIIKQIIYQASLVLRAPDLGDYLDGKIKLLLDR